MPYDKGFFWRDKLTPSSGFVEFTRVFRPPPSPDLSPRSGAMGGASRLLMLLATPFPGPSSVFRLARRPAIPVAALSTAIPTSSHSISRRRRLLIPSRSRVRFGFFLKPSAEIHTQAAAAYGDAVTSAPHLWPEWSRLVEHLASGGYSNKRRELPSDPVDPDDDSFVDGENLAEEFVEMAEACLRFARDQPGLLRLLPRKDIEVIVENASPFLFRNGVNSEMRLRSYLRDDGTNGQESERAGTLDIMRYLLSNVCKYGFTHNDYLGVGELVETSTRNLFSDLVKINIVSQKSRPVNPVIRQISLKPDPSLKPQGQNIEMKRGDWICAKCTFMNFARNMTCLECNEARPKRVLTGGEWDCPQCDFFNYGRNMSCLRCDCRRPPDTATVDQILKGSSISRSEIDSKLAANDEKAERWFSKMSQLGDGDDLSNAITDEDFPEIMPMRKGVNRFVVSTRKTPLERRLANAQINSDSGNSVSSMGDESPPSGVNGMRPDKSNQSSISQSLDRILGRPPAAPGANSQASSGEINVGSKFTPDKQRISNQRRDPNYVPFVPLPADMFSKSQKTNNEQYLTKEESVLKDPKGASEKNIGRDSSDPAERWPKKSSELDTTSAIADEDFPEIMPMRKGENRFVISKKKDRSLTSPQYKKRMAMEQANTSNFVPFVPFPPDYFSKKKSQSEASSSVESTSEGSSSPEKVQEESRSEVSSSNVGGNAILRSEIKHINRSSNANYSSKDFNEKMESTNVTSSMNSVRLPNNTSDSESGTRKNNYVQNSDYVGASGTASSRQKESSQSSEESWKPSFSGKSLEGSAVSKEPDPLDMSEEAKAARWFRRVAQIKDISELSNIPDEDFPEIMPMRKGVNRFVVSKRKTPLERRLTSAQYRRNLPIISSEPEKDNQQNSG